MNCNQTYNQIDKDMSLFSPFSLNMNDISDEIVKTYDQIYSQSLCHYVIKNNQVLLIWILRFCMIYKFLDIEKGS